MKKALLAVLAGLIFSITGYGQTVTPYEILNTSKNDYAITFRSTCDGMEVWLTTNKPNSNDRSRRIMISKVGRNGIAASKEAPSGINHGGKSRPNDVILDGSPTFSACDPNYGIFVSNRLHEGKNYDNDLYEIRSYVEDEWEIKRIDAVNSTAWDDTPCLSPDGNFLYFSSGRKAEGWGRSDLYLSQRKQNGEWGKPKPLDEINEDKFNEQTPFVANDGYMYYATDKTGDFDIWRVKLNHITGKPIAGTEEAIPFKGVNKKGSHEGDPSFSPGRNWFIFSSDATPKKDKDLFFIRMNETADKLFIKSILRTKEFNDDFQEFEDVAKPFYDATIKVEDIFSGETAEALPDENGLAVVNLPYNAGTRPDQDRRIREVLVYSTERILSYETAHDTLLYEVGANCKLEHTVFIWDSKIFESPDCSQNFPITNVEFFITGYWCPTTLKYRHLTPCQSVFCDENCTVVPEITQPCLDNDLYRYEVIQPKIERRRQYGLCADLSEVDAHGDEWSNEVDEAIEAFVDKMKSALKNPCIARAIKKDKIVNIEIIGWTDPRPISDNCLYTGDDIDFNASDIILDGYESKSYFKGGILKNGTPFSRSGSNGNQLLSEIRAFNTALLLDSLWKIMIPRYTELRAAGKIDVHAIGKAVSQQSIAMEKQRSVNVRISAEAEGELVTLDDIAELGKSVALCGNECMENIMCREIERTSDVVLSDVDVVEPVKEEEVVSTFVLAESSPEKAFKQAVISSLPEFYAVQFFSSEEEDEAKIVAQKLVSQGLDNIRVTTYRNINGVLYYKVLYNRYVNDGDAKVFVGTDGYKIAQKLGLSMPHIIAIER
jgi:hypothetical protein